MDIQKKRNIPDIEIKQALIDACGNLLVLKSLHPEISEKCLSKYLAKNQNALLEARSTLLAKAEQILLQNLNSDNELLREKAAEFILKQRAGSEYLAQPQIAQQVVISDAEKAVQIKNIFGQ